MLKRSIGFNKPHYVSNSLIFQNHLFEHSKCWFCIFWYEHFITCWFDSIIFSEKTDWYTEYLDIHTQHCIGHPWLWKNALAKRKAWLDPKAKAKAKVTQRAKCKLRASTVKRKTSPARLGHFLWISVSSSLSKSPPTFWSHQSAIWRVIVE